MQKEFMDAVCPQQGYIHIKGLGENHNPPLAVAYKNFLNLQEALDYANKLSDSGYDSYFCTASLRGANDKKELKNFCASRIVQFDLDVQEGSVNGKKYASLEEAKSSLFQFLRDAGIPRPALVTSGYGIHGYFIFDRDITYNEKTELSKAFVALAREHNIKIDAGSTHDLTKLLRVPGTKNYKYGTVKDVELKHLPKVRLVVEEFQKLVKVKRLDTFLDSPPPEGSGDIQGIRRILQGATVRSWPHILQRSKQIYPIKIKVKTNGKEEIIEISQSKGCEQIRRAWVDRAGTEEPIWKGIMGIIMECDGTLEEKEQWAIEISKGHPKFNESETYQKLINREGYPTTCKWLKLQDPAPCENCEFANRAIPMASPLQLSQIYAEATPEDNIIEAHADDVGGMVTVTIPDDYPFPYFRSKAGGVIYRGVPPDKKVNKTEEEETVEDTIIYQRDFWLHRRVEDMHSEASRGGGGAVGHWMHLTPNDGLKEIIIPASLLGKPDALTAMLQSHSIHVVGTKAKMLINYINAFMEYDQTKRVQLKARESFGWHDNNTHFLIGKREINEQGIVEFSPVCRNLETLHTYYSKEGTLDGWKSVINTYNNPGNEMRGLALFMGFGTPLYKFLNVGSAILHLTNPASGVGKSTIQMCVNSIWGHPIKSMLSLNDTPLAIQSRMASLKNFPVCVDEVTNCVIERMSDFILHFSNNRERNRMQAHVNAERANMSAWETLGFFSGNNSLIDMLKAFKSHAGGERARIMEVFVPKDNNLTKAEADRLFHDTLPHNYGMAGELFMTYVMQNLALVKHRVKQKQLELDSLIGINSEDRFHSAMLAVAMAGGEIAHELGLHDIDCARIERFAIESQSEFVVENTSHKAAVRDVHVIMSTALSRLSGNIVVVDGVEDKKTVMNKGYYRMPMSQIYARYEKATGIAAVAERQWLEFCTAERISVDETIRSLKDAGLYIGSQPYDLAAGTDMPPMSVECIVFKHSKNWDPEDA